MRGHLVGQFYWMRSIDLILFLLMLEELVEYQDRKHVKDHRKEQVGKIIDHHDEKFLYVSGGTVIDVVDPMAVSSSGEVNYSGIKTKENRLAFIRSFGVEIDESSEEESAFRMPEDFDRVILGYNILQQKQGLDLSKYKNKKVTRYTYKVTNYKDGGEVFANLFIYRGKVVACDLSSAEAEGFVIPLTLVARENLK